jgi:hypothetical protein
MIDRYTKAVLTIIAAALVALVAQNMSGGSRADSAVQKVVICGDEAGSNCVGVDADRTGHYRLRTNAASN